MEGKVANFPYNISHCHQLLTEALDQGAKIVALPEFFTTPIIYDKRLFACSLPTDNEALQMLKDVSKKYRAIIGGSYLEKANADVYNTYVLVEPNGTIHRHRKDIPTMVDNAFYKGGNDKGVTSISDIQLGMAMCWETIRSQTVYRLRGKVELMMTGSHWWSEPGWPFLRRYFKRQAKLNADHMYRAPGRFALLVGAPLLHAAHCGEISGEFLLTSKTTVSTKTQLIGETQIVDAKGKILARRKAEQGPGVIFGESTIGKNEFLPMNTDGFWLEKLPIALKAMWKQQNWAAKKVYEKARKNGWLKTIHEFNDY